MFDDASYGLKETNSPLMWSGCVREMTLHDYDQVYALWKKTEYISLNECDSRPGIERYLARNPGLCFVAEETGQIIGVVLCGHDGRRGFLRHMAVAPTHRDLGLARVLIQKSLAGLDQQDISRCNIFVGSENARGLSFWGHIGWSYLRRYFSYVANINAPAAGVFA